LHLDLIDQAHPSSGVHLAYRSAVTCRPWDEELQRSFAEPVQPEQARRRPARDERTVAEIQHTDAEELLPGRRVSGKPEAVRPDALEHTCLDEPTDRRLGQAQRDGLVDTDDAELFAGVFEDLDGDAHTRMCAWRRRDRKPGHFESAESSPGDGSAD
jgi:hypothetical protein